MEGPTTATWIAVIIAAYGAVLSTLLAWRQFWVDRRRLRVNVRPLLYAARTDAVLHVLEVRAVNESHRPVRVRQAGVITVTGTVFHPMTLTPPQADERTNRSAMLEDGEDVVFYFDLLSFEGGYLPKAVWVEDVADRRYTKRLSRKDRERLAESVARTRDQLGPDVDSQRDLIPDTYRR